MESEVQSGPMEGPDYRASTGTKSETGAPAEPATLQQERPFVLNVAATMTTIHHNDDNNEDGALCRMTVYPPSILPSFLSFTSH